MYVVCIQWRCRCLLTPFAYPHEYHPQLPHRPSIINNINQRMQILLPQLLRFVVVVVADAAVAAVIASYVRNSDSDRSSSSNSSGSSIGLPMARSEHHFRCAIRYYFEYAVLTFRIVCLVYACLCGIGETSKYVSKTHIHPHYEHGTAQRRWFTRHILYLLAEPPIRVLYAVYARSHSFTCQDDGAHWNVDRVLRWHIFISIPLSYKYEYVDDIVWGIW